MSLDKLTLLYVEDEKELSELMKELLEDEVGTLLIAGNGEEGLNLFEEYHPDIVMSDIYMPKVDGLSMSEKIKEKFPEQPIILLTAFNNTEDLRRAIDIGIDRYINKPVISQEYIDKPLQEMAKRIDQQRELEALAHRIENQSKCAAVGEVISHITHQWKQPLAVMSAKIAKLKLKRELGEEISAEDIECHMNESMHQIRFLSDTIDDFRDFLRPKEDPSSFIIKEQLRKVTSLVGSVLFNNKITLVLSDNEEILVGFPNKLIHVIMNLVNNAKDALIQQDAAERYIIITAMTDEHSYTLTVQDSGGGIPEDIMDKIFEPYFTTKDTADGTGLGLYMSKEFVIGHMCGSIKVSNKHFEHEGKSLYGTCFEITIPRKIETVCEYAS